jgi:hypothetical protein
VLEAHYDEIAGALVFGSASELAVWRLAPLEADTIDELDLALYFEDDWSGAAIVDDLLERFRAAGGHVVERDNCVYLAIVPKHRNDGFLVAAVAKPAEQIAREVSISFVGSQPFMLQLAGTTLRMTETSSAAAARAKPFRDAIELISAGPARTRLPVAPPPPGAIHLVRERKPPKRPPPRYVSKRQAAKNPVARQVPAELEALLARKHVLYPGPGCTLVFRPSSKTDPCSPGKVLVHRDGVMHELDVPELRWPYPYAFSQAGDRLYLAFDTELVGIELATLQATRFVALATPPAADEFGGSMARTGVAVAGPWVLAAVPGRLTFHDSRTGAPGMSREVIGGDVASLGTAGQGRVVLAGSDRASWIWQIGEGEPRLVFETKGRIGSSWEVDGSLYVDLSVVSDDEGYALERSKPEVYRVDGLASS